MDIILYNSEFKQIEFYLLDKNRLFIITEDSFKKEDDHVYYPLKSCLPGSYSISAKNKNQNLSIAIRVKNNVLYRKKNNIICFKIKVDPEITINNLDTVVFINIKEKLKIGLTKSALLLWTLYWFNLHYMSYHYPNSPSEEDKKQIKDLTLFMCDNGISCNKCKYHFKKWCEENPIEKNYNSKEELINWYFTLHNDINKRNKKKIFTREEVDKLYEIGKNNEIISEFKLDIIALFKNKDLKSFPNYLNNEVKNLLWKKFDVFQDNWLDKL